VTNDRNDRRRRPSGGGRRGGSGQQRGSWRPDSTSGPSRNPNRSDSSRGFTPDSGYRPAGSSNDSFRGRRSDSGYSGGRPGSGDSSRGRGGPSQGGRQEQHRQGPRQNGERREGYGPRGPGAPQGGRGPRDYRGGRPEERQRFSGDRRPQGNRDNRDPNYGNRPPRDRYRPDGRGGAPRDDRNRSSAGPPAAARGVAPEPGAARGSKVDPFDLFCAYHLGITADKKFRPANLNEVARRFSMGPGELKQALQDYGMDAAVVMEKEFDMAMAQLDIELAPEGIDRVELARQLYADFLEAPRRKIDWKKIIEEDIRENAKVFGRKD
jgi:hypothetical protein